MFRKPPAIALAAIVSLSLCAAAQASIVLPVTGGTAAGSSYENIGNFFDAQPATPPIAGATTDNFGSGGGYYTNDGRGVYIDFGADWSAVTITEIFYGLKQYGNDATGTPDYHWSSDTKLAYEPGEGDTVAPDMGLFGWTSATSDKSWQQVFSGSVTPGARYLIVAFDGTQEPGNRIEELVFVGNVPEPASLCLLAAGGLVMMLRRRK